MSFYAEYSTLIDSGLVTALALIVWAAYRELRRRKSDQPGAHLSGSAS
jgi:hypothetical protein